MIKMRIHELSRKMSLLSKDLIFRLKTHGIYAQKSGTKNEANYQTLKNKFFNNVLNSRSLKDLANKKNNINIDSHRDTKKSFVKRSIEVSDSITVGDLAKKMHIKTDKLITQLIKMGTMVSINQAIGFDLASMLCEELGFICKNTAFKESQFIQNDIGSDISTVPRAPIITIMGHVDHGKTTLLNTLRKEKKSIVEKGGITQHITAYTIDVNGSQITMIDTPGHEFFSAIRSRGAKITDIVVLVISMDDGLKQQTKESIEFAQSNNVPIIIAINKIDLPVDNTNKIYRELLKYKLVPIEWGGETSIFKISAHKKIGISELLNGILEKAEHMKLTTSSEQPATGIILDCKIDKGQGPLASVLIKSGVLKLGDIVVSGYRTGKVKAITNTHGSKISIANAGSSVQIAGFAHPPQAGDIFNVVNSEKSAKVIASNRINKSKQNKYTPIRQNLISFDNQNPVKLGIIIKADTFGSIDAIKHGLNSLDSTNQYINLIQSGIGNISEGDINLASISKCIILGFNIQIGAKIQVLARHQNITINTYGIIYDLFEDIKSRIEKFKTPKARFFCLGKAKVRKIFNFKKDRRILGCYVFNGKLNKSGNIKIMRSGRFTEECKINNIRRFKDDVNEINSGLECGLILQSASDIKINDILECYITE